MSALHRNQRLTLDCADGLTFRECAVKYKMSAGRVHQIYTKTINELRLSHLKHPSGKVVAAALVESKKSFYRGSTPEGFYNQLLFENERDAESKCLAAMRREVREVHEDF